MTQLSFISTTLQRKNWSAKSSTPFTFWVSSCKMGGAPHSHRHAMAGLIRTFLTDIEILNGLAIDFNIWSFGTYTESPGFKKNPNVVYATTISKITNFSERLKDRTLRKYNFVNSFDVKTDFKGNKVLQGTPCGWKMQNIQQEFFLHAFNCNDELWNKLS